MRAAVRGALIGVLVISGTACTYGAGGQGETGNDDTGGSSSSTGAPDDTVHEVCGAAGSSSMLDELGQCSCVLGSTWNNPYDPRDFGCHEVEPREIPCAQACDATAITSSECVGNDVTHACDCADGYDWCVHPVAGDASDGNDDAVDTRCCVDPAQPAPDAATDAGSDTSATTGGSGSDSTSAASESSSDGSSGGQTASGTSEQ